MPATQHALWAPSKPDLRCPGKGANKTPPERVASDLPQVGGEPSFRRRKSASLSCLR